ncbi:SIMPL domain-containing protein [Ancylobacter terrae]|uniref:SIMPL domain-containing protein n=1 Tax=Ancylobacter sp. sgz301288 TaxID=3342077 RepID=UPI00385DDB4C
MKLSSAALLAAFAVAGAAPAAAQEAMRTPRIPTLSVSGEGIATAAPDLARFSTGVVSAAKTAREALDANSKQVADVIAAIKAAGVEPRDIATSGFTVQPQYSQPKPNSTEPPRISGYEVRNTVSVRLRNLALLGGLLDSMITEGANQVGGIEFDIAEPGKLEDEARTAAVKDARRQAEIIAEAAGQRIVRVVSIAEDGGGMPPMPRMMAAPMMAKQDSVPVEAGESEVRARVSIVYEIEPR